jgi:5-formyltetrahydrofolate cyclo-ligase
MSEEINTEEILQSALQSKKECFIPRYIGPNMDMLRLYSWQDYEDLPKTRWNIKQPPDDDTSRESALDSGRCNFLISFLFSRQFNVELIIHIMILIRNASCR